MIKIDKIKKFTAKHSRLLLWLFIIAYIILFSFLSLKKYYNFDYNALDLAIFNQVFFNTLHGRWFDLTVNLNTYLADHFTPVIILLLPFYWLKQSAETLLILQSICLALSAWPLYVLAKAVLKSRNLALLVGVLWLFNPFVQAANIYEFHLMSLSVFCILWTIYFYYKKNFLWFFILMILSLMTREDISLVMLGFFILSLIEKRQIKWWLISLLIPLIYFLGAINIIDYFATDGDYKFLIYYRWLGGHDLPSIIWQWITHPWQVLLHVLNLKNIFNFFVLFLPLLLIPLFKPSKYLWLLALPLLQFLLSAPGLVTIVYQTHYSLLLLPAIFVGFIFTFKYLKDNPQTKLSKFWQNYQGAIYLILFISTIYFFITLSPLRNLVLFTDKESQNNRQIFLDQIPLSSSLIASESFLSHLSNRQTIYPFCYSYYGYKQFAREKFIAPEVDYIFLDYREVLSNFTELNDSIYFKKYVKNMANDWRQVLDKYTLISAHNDLMLWKNIDQIDDQHSLLLYDFDDLNKKTDSFFIKSALINNPEQNILQLTWQAHSDLPAGEYLLRFYSQDQYFDVPLGYGLWPVQDWPNDKAISFYYYLDKNIESWQLFKWQGVNYLDNNGQVNYHLSLETKLENQLLDTK
jgi:uncharacterized membrane protein